jgi:hypothetical protein
MRFSLAARVLAGVAAVLAVGAFIAGIPAAAGAGASAAMVETWRTVGFATFAALFAYLAVRPGAVGVWAIAVANKLALTIAAVSYGPGVAGTTDSVIWDGALTVLLVGGLACAMLDARRTAG